MSVQEIDLQVRESSISGYSVSLLSGSERLAEVFLRHSDEIRRLPGALEAAKAGGAENLFFDLARRLHDQVFQEPIAAALKRVRQAGPVRLRIRAEPPEIARIPWEALHDGKESLSLAGDMHFSRLPLDAPGFKRAMATRELSILAASAQTDGTSELEAIEKALSKLSREGYVRVTRLRAATLETIQSALESDQFRGVAIVAPGPVGSDGTTGYLRLAGEGGRTREHNLTEIAPILYGHRGIRFLLLSAGCAHPGWRGESYEGLIRLCFGMKISGALSMPLSISPESYVRFLRAFFGEAVAGKPIDEAAGTARRAIREKGGVEFAIPLLYAGDPSCLEVTGVATEPEPAMEPPPEFEPPPADEPEPAPAAAPAAEPAPEPARTSPRPSETALEFPTEDHVSFDTEMLEEEEELEAAVDHFAEEGDRRNEAAALDRLGRSQVKRGRARKAILSFRRSLEILEGMGDISSSLSVLLHLARAFERAGDSERALDTFRQEHALAQKVGDQRRVASALVHIGTRHATDGNLSSAIEVWQQATRIWEDLKEDGRAADLLTRIGAAHQGLGELDEAAATYQGSLEIHRQREDRLGMATALNNLGNVALRTRGRDEAAAHYTEALELFRRIDNRDGIASVCHNLANISLGMGDYQRSFDLSREAVAIAREHGLHSLLLSADRLLTRIREMVGEENFREMESSAPSSGSPGDV